MRNPLLRHRQDTPHGPRFANTASAATFDFQNALDLGSMRTMSKEPYNPG